MMRRRYFLMTLGTFLLILGSSAAVVLGLIRFEPRWYRKASLPPGPERIKHSEEFYAEFCEMISAIGSEREWYAHFTDSQINSYFEEGFKQSGLAVKLLPEDISEPRVRIEDDRMHLGIRYGRGAWSTVISIEMSMWLTPREPNVVALELVGFHVGALPISVQSLLERVSEIGRQNGIEVTWYRNGDSGHPVAILRFQADQPRSTMQLQAVRLEQGAITVRGRTNDFASRWISLEKSGFAMVQPK